MSDGTDRIILKGGFETTDPRLDAVPQFDDRSLNYPVMATIDNTKPRSYTWNARKYPGFLNQFREGACVGFGWAGELMFRPAEIPVTNETARGIYKRGQQIDYWPGENYEGTSVIAGAKATMELLNQDGRAHMGEYRWAFGGDETVLALSKGPCVIGVEWFSGMFDTDETGFITPTGGVAGRHCVVLRGIRSRFRKGTVERTLANLDRDITYFLGRNSWGRSWGVEGDFKISLASMDLLLGRGGEVCVPMLRQA